jgi:superfamily II DNA or RNA helicase
MNLTKKLLFPHLEPWLKLAELRVREKQLRIYFDGADSIRALMLNEPNEQIRASYSASASNEILAKCSCRQFSLSEGCEHLAALALSLGGSAFEATHGERIHITFNPDLPSKPDYQESNLTLEWLALLKKDLRFSSSISVEKNEPIEIWYGLDFGSPGSTPQRFDQPVFLFMREVQGRDSDRLKVFQVTDENLSRVRSQEDIKRISLFRHLMPATLSPYWRQRLGKTRRSLCFLPQDGLWQHLEEIANSKRLFIHQSFQSQPGIPTSISVNKLTTKALSFSLNEIQGKEHFIQVSLNQPQAGEHSQVDIDRKICLIDNEIQTIHTPTLPMALHFLIKEKLILGLEAIDQLKYILRENPWLVNFFTPKDQLKRIGLDIVQLTFDPLIRIEISKQPLGLEIKGTLLFHYPEAPTPLIPPRFFQNGMTESDDWYHNGVLYTRDTEREDHFIQQLKDCDLEFLSLENQCSFYLNHENFLKSILMFQEMEFTVMIDEKKLHAAKSMRTSVKSQDDWFELKTEGKFINSDGSLFEVDGEEFLEGLLDHQWRELGIVPLKDGKLGVLATDWLERLIPLTGLSHFENGVLKLHTSQAFALELALEQDRDKLENLSWGELKERSSQTLHPDDIILSEDIHATLRPYQKEALAWFLYLSTLELGGILADDMGLGKTLQTLAFLEQERQSFCLKSASSHFSLVVVPRTLMTNWQREAQKFTPRLNLVIYDGTPQKRAEILSRLLKTKSYTMILCTYGTLRLDIMELKKIPFLHFILDEAHLLKNPDTLIYKAAQLIKARTRFALSGTPAQNRLGELTTLLRLLVPKIFARKMPLDSLDQADEITRGKILQACSAFILRRTKEEVLKDLPEKIDSTLSIELPEDHKAFYTSLKQSIQKQFLPSENSQIKNQIHPLEALLRLRQAAIHPKLVNPSYTGRSGKFLSLLDRLDEIIQTKSKALVFSQFTQALHLLEQELNKKEIKSLLLTGKTHNRQKIIDRFTQDDEYPIFLLSLKAGGVGLNLTQANYIFILDPWWNPSQEEQAIDRSHRMGQKSTVFSYKMISKNTIEEKVQKLQLNKTHLIDQIQGKSDFDPKDHLELMNLFMD